MPVEPAPLGKSRLVPACPGAYRTAILLGLGGAVFRSLSLNRVSCVLNSMAANRRLAFRMVAIQAAIAALVALAFLGQDARAALAAAIGGGAMVLGSLLLAWRSMMGPAYSAGLALTRLAAGIVLKWFVVIGALYLALVRFGLPPLPLLAGLVGTMAASFLIHILKA